MTRNPCELILTFDTNLNKFNDKFTKCISMVRCAVKPSRLSR